MKEHLCATLFHFPNEFSLSAEHRFSIHCKTQVNDNQGLPSMGFSHFVISRVLRWESTSDGSATNSIGLALCGVLCNYQGCF